MNIDGIKKTKNHNNKPKLVVAPKRILKVDGISPSSRIKTAKVAILKSSTVVQKPFAAGVTYAKSYTQNRKAVLLTRFISRQKVTLLAAVVALFLAFGGGAWAALTTAKTAAIDQSQADAPAVNYQIPLPDAQLPPTASAVNNDVLFNTPIEYLKNYLATVAQPDIIEQRTQLLTQYLKDQKSPLADAAETIAQQPHWQLILAIAFAESTLGKNCSDNNCSNIGVKPGAPSWRQYASYQDWVVDFNRLLDKKYNDWTLEQMCGVYVKPCNPNWLLATQEVMDDLKARDIN